MGSDLTVGFGLSPLKGGFTPQRSSDIVKNSPFELLFMKSVGDD